MRNKRTKRTKHRFRMHKLNPPPYGMTPIPHDVLHTGFGWTSEGPLYVTRDNVLLILGVINHQFKVVYLFFVENARFSDVASHDRRIS
jgi:hypothetical protein